MEVEDPAQEIEGLVELLQDQGSVSVMSEAREADLYEELRGNITILTARGFGEPEKMWRVEKASECMQAYEEYKDAEFLRHAELYLYEQIPCPPNLDQDVQMEN